MEKRCSKCDIEKDVSEFDKKKENSSGYTGYCKECRRKQKREYVRKHKDHIIKYQKEYHKKNKIYLRKQQREYVKKNKSSIEKYQKKYRVEYYQKNKDKIYKKEKARRDNNPAIRLKLNISSQIRRSLKNGKGGLSWEKLVGYTLNDLIRHLKKQFHSGMTLDNYGEWHLDHRIPKSVFNFSDPSHIDFKRCWALSNLQPLWAFDNLSKNDSREGHFQPSLELAL